jgi:RNA polymerase sigma-70 factor (ECF subfamily)
MNIDAVSRTDDFRSFHERDEIEVGFRRLDADQRLVVVLHYYLDLPLPDVAVALGVPVGTVKSRLNRGLASMRFVMRPRVESDADAKEVAR